MLGTARSPGQASHQQEPFPARTAPSPLVSKKQHGKNIEKKEKKNKKNKENAGGEQERDIGREMQGVGGKAKGGMRAVGEKLEGCCS